MPVCACVGLARRVPYLVDRGPEDPDTIAVMIICDPGEKRKSMSDSEEETMSDMRIAAKRLKSSR